MTSTGLAFTRRSDRRVVLGVAGGFADQHGLDVVVVRAALVMLSFAGGLGIVLYLLGQLLSESSGVVAAPQPFDQRRNLSVAATSLGLALVMRSTGLWLGDEVMSVVIVVVSGVALLGVLRPDGSSTAVSTAVSSAVSVSSAASVSGSASPSALEAVVAGRHARSRITAGAALVAVGIILVGRSGGVSAGLQVGVYATALTIVGVAVLLGPWLARTAQDAAEERRQRIRLDEREAMAAHLHDSVLQTLALIQRSADDPRRTITLARRQEAELRQWLYGAAGATATTLAGALQEMVHEVEDRYDIRIEPVVVGDRPIDDGFVALIAAIREACVNAAKHSGVQDVAVYVEVGHDVVEAFVRDRGIGFDPAAVSPEGRGITRSITARLERIGGTATIASTVGVGTEVRLAMPLAAGTSPVDAESPARR